MRVATSGRPVWDCGLSIHAVELSDTTFVSTKGGRRCPSPRLPSIVTKTKTPANSETVRVTSRSAAQSAVLIKFRCYPHAAASTQLLPRLQARGKQIDLIMK